jgi:zinc/manganese transport system ATP-binding protein
VRSIEGAGDDVVVLEGVSVVYEGERVPVIEDIDLRIRKGEFVVVLGPNGAGKTTLLEAINGILSVTSGRVDTLGIDVSDGGLEVRKRTGYVIQNFSLDPLDPFLVRDVVMMARAGRIGLLRFPSGTDWETVDDALEELGMSRFSSRPVGKLSGGEFQKVLIARAIAQGPDLLLLDEPLANLDVDAKAEVLDLMVRWKEQGLTVMAVSHDIGAVPEVCDRIVVLEKGRIVLDGPREEVLASEELSRLFVTRGCCR